MPVHVGDLYTTSAPAHRRRGSVPASCQQCWQCLMATLFLCACPCLRVCVCALFVFSMIFLACAPSRLYPSLRRTAGRQEGGEVWLIGSSAYYLAQDGEKPCVIPRKLQGLVPFLWQLAHGHVAIHVAVVVCPQNVPPSLMEACVAMADVAAILVGKTCGGCRHAPLPYARIACSFEASERVTERESARARESVRARHTCTYTHTPTHPRARATGGGGGGACLAERAALFRIAFKLRGFGNGSVL